jgi:hypothetical protein
VRHPAVGANDRGDTASKDTADLVEFLVDGCKGVRALLALIEKLLDVEKVLNGAGRECVGHEVCLVGWMTTNRRTLSLRALRGNAMMADIKLGFGVGANRLFLTPRLRFVIQSRFRWLRIPFGIVLFRLRWGRALLIGEHSSDSHDEHTCTAEHNNDEQPSFFNGMRIKKRENVQSLLAN